MTIHLGRRSFLTGVLGAGIAAQCLPTTAARAGTPLTGVDWGAPYIDPMKAIAAGQKTYDVNWVLHEGGSAAILSKIKAARPSAPYDFVSAWDPVFQAAMREGWTEPYTLKDVPNLEGVPEKLIYKDGDGKWAIIPRSLSGSHFFYREDKCPFPLTKIEDLLDPRLEGQVSWPDPVYNTNMQMLILALRGGGDEHNMEPGWDFIKKMAKAKVIGRVAHTDPDAINSISSGETSVGFAGIGIMAELRKSFPIKLLTKMPGDTGFLAVLYQEGWFVLKGGKSKEAFEFINYCMSPENNERLNEGAGGIPTNPKSKLSAALAPWSYSADELKSYTYAPDYTYVSQQVDGWMKRWEKEVAPLL
jgi:putative spermidine/putrescine transport system substrate-binding protein